MSDLILDLVIVPIGPRQNFKREQGAVWHFALQPAASFTDRPQDDGEAAAMAKAMLPWIFLDRDTNPPSPMKVFWRLLPLAGDVHGDATAKTMGALPLTSPPGLRRVLNDGAWRDFALEPQPQRVFKVDTAAAPVEATKEVMPLPTALFALGGSTPEGASGELVYTWYFDVELTEDNLHGFTDDAAIAAWPEAFIDARTATAYTYKNDAVEAADAILRIPYRNPADAKSLRARTKPFPVKRLPNTDEDAL